MLNRNLLKAAIAAKGYNQKMLCKEIGMPEPTFSRKLKSGVFGTDEVMKICECLEIREPAPIFLAREVNCEVTTGVMNL